MGQFHHPNLVKLYGVVTIGYPVSYRILSLFVNIWTQTCRIINMQIMHVQHTYIENIEKCIH